MRWNRRRICLALGVLFVVIVLGPVVVRQLWPTTRRKLEGVRLEDISYRDVQFPNEKSNLALAGMLLVPDGDGPFPAVVMIHGSGTSRRNNSWYLTPASYLQANGIVVLLPDKRGSEQSEGDWRSSSFDDLATDTVAAIDFLRQQEEVPIAAIGIVGMSQGGHIAPLVAQQTDVAFVVNVSGGAGPMRQALLFEEQHNLRQLGFLPGIADGIALLSTPYIMHVGQDEFWDAIGDYDPLPHWRDLNVPTLVLYGRDDTNVNVQESAARLRSLDKSNVEVEIYADCGHAVEEPAAMGNTVIRADALARIRDFIHDAVDDTAL